MKIGEGVSRKKIVTRSESKMRAKSQKITIAFLLLLLFLLNSSQDGAPEAAEESQLLQNSEQQEDEEGLGVS